MDVYSSVIWQGRAAIGIFHVQYSKKSKRFKIVEGHF